MVTLCEYLEKSNAPKVMFELVRSINDLAYYVTECYRAPDALKRDPIDRFNIEEAVITTINAIAEAGGQFHGPQTYSFPRQEEKPAKSKK